VRLCKILEECAAAGKKNAKGSYAAWQLSSGQVVVRDGDTARYNAAADAFSKLDDDSDTDDDESGGGGGDDGGGGGGGGSSSSDGGGSSNSDGGGAAGRD
jgi:hypothetical protein